jgi:hypothetical protein
MPAGPGRVVGSGGRGCAVRRAPAANAHPRPHSRPARCRGHRRRPAQRKAARRPHPRRPPRNLPRARSPALLAGPARFHRELFIDIPGRETERLAALARLYSTYIVVQCKARWPEVIDKRFFTDVEISTVRTSAGSSPGAASPRRPGRFPAHGTSRRPNPPKRLTGSRCVPCGSQMSSRGQARPARLGTARRPGTPAARCRPGTGPSFRSPDRVPDRNPTATWPQSS